jgi:excinuclease ABC subunit C
MVRYVDAASDKRGYRHFKIQGVEGQDDFGMMREVVSRRYRRVMEEHDEMPDLIMIDGGKGQLSAAIAALRSIDADFDEFDVIGLAKAREKGTKYAGIREARAYERVFGIDDKEPRILSPTSASVNLLAQIRDESHRFAITHHRKLRGRKVVASALDGIPGVGKKRKMQLLKQFGSVKVIRDTSLEDLAAVPGMPKKVAEAIVEKLAGTG